MKSNKNFIMKTEIKDVGFYLIVCLLFRRRTKEYEKNTHTHTYIHTHTHHPKRVTNSLAPFICHNEKNY